MRGSYSGGKSLGEYKGDRECGGGVYTMRGDGKEIYG